MYQLKSKKMTELEKRLAEKIRLLKEEIQRHPAYPRRKKDQKNREDFYAVFLFTGLIGITTFGAAWLAVALIGSVLSLIIVESGLFFSLALGLSSKRFYDTFLWIRDVFASQKIKNQNKDFDQMDNQLRELEKLTTKKSSLISRINYQLNYVSQWLPSKFFASENTECEPLSLKEQIQRLKQTTRELPAYARRKKDRQVSKRINEYWKYYLLGLIFLGLIIILIELLYPPIVLLIPTTLAFLFVPFATAIAFGPILVSNIGRMTYLFIRDMFSSTVIKAENKQLTQLEKALDKLVDLENQLEQIVKSISNKLESVDFSVQSTVAHEKEERFSEDSKNDYAEKNIKYGSLFKGVAVNQTVDSLLSETPSLTN